MRTHWLAALILTLTLALPALAAPPGAPTASIWTGTVEAVDARQGTLTVAKKRFRVPVSLRDLLEEIEEGDEVDVYHQNRNVTDLEVLEPS